MATNKTGKSDRPRSYSGWRPPWLIFAYEAYQHRLVKPNQPLRKTAHRYELRRIPITEQEKTIVQGEHTCKDCSARKALEPTEDVIPSWLKVNSGTDTAKSIRSPWTTPHIKTTPLCAPTALAGPDEHQHQRHNHQQGLFDTSRHPVQHAQDHIIEETNRLSGRVYASMHGPHMHDFRRVVSPQLTQDFAMPARQHSPSHLPTTLPHSRARNFELLHPAEHDLHFRHPQTPLSLRMHRHHNHHTIRPNMPPQSALRRDDDRPAVSKSCCRHHHHHHHVDHPIHSPIQNQLLTPVLLTRSEPVHRRVRSESIGRPRHVFDPHSRI